MNDIISIIKKVNGIITDSHIVYTSGKHGSVYINKDAVYPHTAETSEIGKMFAEKYKDHNIEVVVGPALGGIILSQWTAYHLSQLTGREVLGLYTEKDEHKNQVFTRGYGDMIKNKNVLVIEDITDTGGSVKKVVDTVKSAGVNVIAAGVMVNRDPINVTSETIGAPFEALGTLKADAVEEADCFLCKQNIPINTSVGHGKKYMQAKGLL